MRYDDISKSAGSSPLAPELKRRMQRPQRHRLLHGYPLAPAMSERGYGVSREDTPFHYSSLRRLIMGVLPHPFCNPKVQGCGFCTFPHQPYGRRKAAAVVESVIQEIQWKMLSQPELYRRKVAALYFGGGTANLTSPESFRRLCRQFTESVDLSDAEVTLEGVPIYFTRRRPLLMDIMREELPARRFRISMGIQTFAEEPLRRMGRLAFGTGDTFREVVETAHQRDFTVSGDFLFNLPSQKIDSMREDVRQALDIGLDHLGLYSLVLFAGLGTEWSKDRILLEGLPDNDAATEHWLELREMLLSSGFYQTTLTNFERKEFQSGRQRFVYEECSFNPDTYDAVGFGPTAISFGADLNFQTAWKTLNPESADDYRQKIAEKREAWIQHFEYDSRDLRILYITRRLAALAIDRSKYRHLFGTDAVEDFPDEFVALRKEGLLDIATKSICPTPTGMFYADSIAGLIAFRQLKERQRESVRDLQGLGHRGESRRVYANDNSGMHM